MLRVLLLLSVLLLMLGCRNSNNQKELKPENVKQGENLFTKYGCFTCHSVKGEKLYGPPLNNILGNEVEVLRDEKIAKVKVDRKYLRRSILEPEYEKVKAYSKQKMPIPDISEEDIEFLLDYIIKINTQSNDKE